MLDNIKGELRIFTKEVEKADGSKRVIFNACCGYSQDKETEEYTNWYVPVNFATALRKDIAKVYEQNSFDVVVSEAWFKAYRDKDGNVRPILFINKAKIVTGNEEEKPKAKKTASKSKPKTDAIDEDDLPF